MPAVRSLRLPFAGLLVIVVAVSGAACRCGRARPSESDLGGGAPRSSMGAAEHATAEERAEYVSSERCGSCHAEPFRAWKTSHHRLAMQVPSETSVLGDFDDKTLRYF